MENILKKPWNKSSDIILEKLNVAQNEGLDYEKVE